MSRDLFVQAKLTLTAVTWRVATYPQLVQIKVPVLHTSALPVHEHFASGHHYSAGIHVGHCRREPDRGWVVGGHTYL